MNSEYVEQGMTAAIRIAASRPMRSLFSPLLAGRATIFLLHRLRTANEDLAGHTADEIHAIITALRASGAHFVSLTDLVDAGRAGREIPRNAVTFTIDDGFHDQIELANIFVRRGCPVSVFVTTSFLDNQSWPWFEQVNYAFNHTRLPKVTINTAAGSSEFVLDSPDARRDAAAQFSRAAKRARNVSSPDLLAAVAHATQVSLPRNAPPRHRPMSWDDVRALEQEGVRFGAHTVSHPIMSQISDADARHEINESIARVQAETRHALPIFAWPNGQREDYGLRDIALLREAGIAAGLGTEDDYANFNEAGLLERGIYELKRFALPHTVRDALQYGTWIERAKQIFRRGKRRNADASP